MAEAEEKLWEIVEESEIALLITLANGYPRVRPMTLIAYEEEGGVWFATSKSSRKVEEIGRNPNVTVCFLDLEGSAYAQLFGKANVIEDRAIKEEFWDEDWEEYWEGPDDPDYVLIHVQVSKAEYYLLEADELWVVEFEE
ncbi:MAG: pyridoxamine 5'-phosphate oxidase family protein [Candidatus Bipolaricaulota bacterium]|nr:pyridoxamine 5'-phosphate oxidase family protein [Candidatus Bipolaricaulota bacterium]MDW8126831.1 pyridoxamine 5'-phosphate oxidase family protein [Candidatus Bipolaricaulota bacterium]